MEERKKESTDQRRPDQTSTHHQGGRRVPQHGQYPEEREIYINPIVKSHYIKKLAVLSPESDLSGASHLCAGNSQHPLTQHIAHQGQTCTLCPIGWSQRRTPHPAARRSNQAVRRPVPCLSVSRTFLPQSNTLLRGMWGKSQNSRGCPKLQPLGITEKGSGTYQSIEGL